MATKIKLLKLLQEMRGFAEFNRRHPAPRPSSPLYLLQLRSHLTETSRGRLRLLVTIDPKDSETTNLPHPVKIKHIPPAAAGDTNPT